MPDLSHPGPLGHSEQVRGETRAWQVRKLLRLSSFINGSWLIHHLVPMWRKMLERRTFENLSDEDLGKLIDEIDSLIRNTSRSYTVVLNLLLKASSATPSR